MAKRVWPVGEGWVITSPFGPRWGTQHRGVDLGKEGGCAGEPIYAAQGGTVVYAGPATGFGGPDPAGWVVIDHPAEDGGDTTVYGHIIREVSVGQRVEAGQRIGHVNPNSSTNGGVAPHLHFEVHKYVWGVGNQMDPIPWLNSQPPGSHAEDSSGNVTFGIDISEHQRDYSLKKVEAEGIDFVILRTNDGTYKDKLFKSHFDDAVSTDMVVGAYMFLRSEKTGSKIHQQVETSLEMLDSVGARWLPMCIDVEDPKNAITKWEVEEAIRLFREAGVRVWSVYTGMWYWNADGYMRNPDWGDLPPLWLSSYSTKHGTPRDIYPDAKRFWGQSCGGRTPTMLQFSSQAYVAGRNVDANAFKGTKEDVQVFIYGQPRIDHNSSLPEAAPTPEPEVAPAVSEEVQGVDRDPLTTELKRHSDEIQAIWRSK